MLRTTTIRHILLPLPQASVLTEAGWQVRHADTHKPRVDVSSVIHSPQALQVLIAAKPNSAVVRALIAVVKRKSTRLAAEDAAECLSVATAAAAQKIASQVGELGTAGRHVCTLTAATASDTSLRDARAMLRLIRDRRIVSSSTVLSSLQIAVLERNIDASENAFRFAAAQKVPLLQAHYHAAMASANQVLPRTGEQRASFPTFRYAGSVYARMCSQGIPASFATTMHLANAVDKEEQIDEVIRLFRHLRSADAEHPQIPAAIAAVLQAVARTAPMGEATDRAVSAYRRMRVHKMRPEGISAVQLAFAFPAATALDAEKALSIAKPLVESGWDPLTGTALIASHGRSLRNVLNAVQFYLYHLRHMQRIPPSVANSLHLLMSVHARAEPALLDVMPVVFNAGVKFNAARDSVSYALAFNQIARKCSRLLLASSGDRAAAASEVNNSLEDITRLFGLMEEDGLTALHSDAIVALGQLCREIHLRQPLLTEESHRRFRNVLDAIDRNCHWYLRHVVGKKQVFTPHLRDGVTVVAFPPTVTAAALGALAASANRSAIDFGSLMATRTWSSENPRAAALRVFATRGGTFLAPSASFTLPEGAALHHLESTQPTLDRDITVDGLQYGTAFDWCRNVVVRDVIAQQTSAGGLDDFSRTVVGEWVGEEVARRWKVTPATD
jgi:hypothetical protein